MFSGIEYKDMAVPIISAVSGIVITLLTLWGKAHYDARRSEDQLQLEDKVSQRSFDADQAKMLTERFKTLFDAYDKRISDLVDETVRLRSDLARVRVMMSWQVVACSHCPEFHKFLETHPDAAA